MASEMKSPLAVHGLRKEYPSFRLQDVSFSLEPGSITGFIGRNGAGKTTTINAMLSFVRPDAGEISFFGLEYPEHDREIKERIGFVSAGMSYYARKRLKAITDVTKTFYPGWDDGAYRKHMDAFGLDERKTPSELSNGMKIKYALALAMSHGAELLILDEPTSGLDPVSREELTEVFLRMKDEGKTVFFSTHITSDLEKCADRILFLQEGKLKADDDLDAFRDAWRIAESGKEIPERLREAACGCCRVRDGYTVLIRKEDAGLFETREASLEEIMIHLEKEGEEA
uniref:ABC transporter n=1 Tax=uncultured bacterium Contigcl_23 TaxID=1393667 RepID=W0FL26_9BACT|nr:ABC transporter [uncultured bacterium Contigcl_23]